MTKEMLIDNLNNLDCDEQLDAILHALLDRAIHSDNTDYIRKQLDKIYDYIVAVNIGI